MSDTTPPQADPTADPTPPSGQQDPDSEKTFTQAELEKIVGERLARERSKYGDYDTLKAKASKFDEVEQANKTELEQARDREATAVAARDEALAHARDLMIRAALLQAATAAGAVDPDAVVQLADRSEVTIDDTGAVTGADTAVKALLDTKPYLVKTDPASSPTSGAAPNSGRNTAGGQITREQLTQMTPDEIDTARREGKLDHLLGRT